MRLLTWNILHGGGTARTPEIALRIVGHNPDVAVVTEFRARTGGQIAGVLADHGLRFQASTTLPSLTAANSTRRSRRAPVHHPPSLGVNGLLVASRFPLSCVDGPAPPRCLAAKWLTVTLEGPGISLAGVHIPDDSRPTEKAAAWHHLLAYARARRDHPCAILGDFNTGRHLEDEPGADFGSTDLLGSLWTLGYRDAWRHLHPGEREYTWKSHLGSGYRIDHAFLSPPLVEILDSAWYSHAERDQRVSDHSALVVELGSKPA